MNQMRFCHVMAIVVAVFFCFPKCLLALSAREIIDKAARRHFGNSFRASVHVDTFQGKKKISQHTMWVMGQIEKEESAFFVDFIEPEESKGLRFLCRVKPDEEPQAYMYLPATGRTMQVSLDDSSTDIGGTGLTVGDFQPLIPEPGQKERLLKDETVRGHDCYVIEVSQPDTKELRIVWIAKDQLHLVKVQQIGAKGKVERALEVVEFFKTDKGLSYPREEEITLPQKGITIKVRQDGGVFGITIPEELFDPATFGTYGWKA
jgi:Outer membrane lipoprotein-sorting protein